MECCRTASSLDGEMNGNWDKHEKLRYPTLCTLKPDALVHGRLTSAEGLSLVREGHMSRDLLNNGQSTTVNAFPQIHFIQVHHHVLVIVGTWVPQKRGRQNQNSN